MLKKSEQPSQTYAQNPDPQSEAVSGNDITHPQEQLGVPGRPPKGLLDWLVRVNSRLMALECEKTETIR